MSMVQHDKHDDWQHPRLVEEGASESEVRHKFWEQADHASQLIPFLPNTVIGRVRVRGLPWLFAKKLRLIRLGQGPSPYSLSGGDVYIWLGGDRYALADADVASWDRDELLMWLKHVEAIIKRAESEPPLG